MRISHTGRCRQSCARSSQHYRVLPSRRILSGASAGAGAWPTVITETDTSRSILTWPLHRQPTLARTPPLKVRVRVSEPTRTSPGRIGFHKSSFRPKSHRFYRPSRQHLRLTRLPPPYRHPGLRWPARRHPWWLSAGQSPTQSHHHVMLLFLREDRADCVPHTAR